MKPIPAFGATIVGLAAVFVLRWISIDHLGREAEIETERLQSEIIDTAKSGRFEWQVVDIRGLLESGSDARLALVWESGVDPSLCQRPVELRVAVDATSTASNGVVFGRLLETEWTATRRADPANPWLWEGPSELGLGVVWLDSTDHLLVSMQIISPDVDFGKCSPRLQLEPNYDRAVRGIRPLVKGAVNMSAAMTAVVILFLSWSSIRNKNTRTR